MKRQVNARMSEPTMAKLTVLAARYGTQAEAIAVAVDRLHESEAGLIRVAKATGHFDFNLMRHDFIARSEAVDNAQARKELIAAIAAHASSVMAGESIDAQREQVRLAANGVLASLNFDLIHESELRSN